MNKKSGEVLTAILIGLALGGVLSVVRYNSWAQATANLRGTEIGVGDYVAERPLEAIGYPVLGAAAGWGVGELLDGGDDDEKEPPRNVIVTSGRDSTVVISGEDGAANNSQQQPTTTTTTTTPAPEDVQ